MYGGALLRGLVLQDFPIHVQDIKARNCNYLRWKLIKRCVDKLAHQKLSMFSSRFPCHSVTAACWVFRGMQLGECGMGSKCSDGLAVVRAAGGRDKQLPYKGMSFLGSHSRYHFRRKVY